MAKTKDTQLKETNDDKDIQHSHLTELTNIII